MTVTMSQAAAAQQDRQCMGTSKQTGQRCKLDPGEGNTLCYWHGGAARQHKRKGIAFRAVDEIAALYDPDAPAITDPIAELQRLGGICRNAMDVCGDKVAELREWDSYDAKGTAQLKGVVQLLLQLMKLCESILTTLAKLGIDERRVQVAEREQLLIIAALRSIAGDPELALTPGQRQAWESVVPRHLKAILSTDGQHDGAA